jgi:hypothetical protein
MVHNILSNMNYATQRSSEISHGSDGIKCRSAQNASVILEKAKQTQTFIKIPKHGITSSRIVAI